MISKKGIDTELKILYTKMTLKWCKENLGINSKKRKKLILDISYKNRKKGKIKSPEAKLIHNPDSFSLVTLNAIKITNAFLKMLSLKAPKNWVQKNPKYRF